MMTSDTAIKVLSFLLIPLLLHSTSALEWTNSSSSHEDHVNRFRPLSLSLPTDGVKVTYALPSTKPRIEVREVKSKSYGDEAPTYSDISVVNTTVILSNKIKRVELICTATSPIKWEYVANDRVSTHILETHYRRIFRHKNLNNVPQNNSRTSVIDNLRSPELNQFESRVVLRGLLESQSGKYICRYYNSKRGSNSYKNAGIVRVFVPGSRIFLAESRIKYIQENETSAIIQCPVSNPRVRVGLQKLNEETYNKTGKLEWNLVSVSFLPSVGFSLKKDTLHPPTLFGTFRCVILGNLYSTNRKNFVVVHIANIDSKYLYVQSSDDTEPCWETPICMKLMRSKRLECFCKDSYGLFAESETPWGKKLLVTEENRQARCSTNHTHAVVFSQLLNETNSDWKVEEFLRNGEDSSDACFREEMIRNNISGTGARVLLQLSKMQGPAFSNSSTFNVTVVYYGLFNWAAGSLLGVEYFPNSSSTANNSGEKFQIDFISDAYAKSHLFPLAHHQTIWRNIVLDMQKIYRVHVFQPDRFSYDWFHISTKLEDAKFTKDEDLGKAAKAEEKNGGFCGEVCLLIFKILGWIGLFVLIVIISVIGFFTCKDLRSFR